MPKKAIDVSAWQGKISTKTWEKNKDDIPIVFLRCSYTEWKQFAMHEDKVFESNIKTAIKAGMSIGVYHYSQAISETEAIKEAKFVLKTIKPYKEKIKQPVTLDFEFGGRLNSSVARKMGKQRCKQIIDAFCKVIRNAGYVPMVYANLSTLNGYIADNIHKDWLIWVAQYNSRCDYRHQAYAWQYTSSGHVSGISGRVDMNIVYGQSAVSTPDNGKKYPYELPKLPHRGWFTSGDKGEEVKKLQRFLNFYENYSLLLDGDCGSKTLEAVRNFQQCEGLKIDGCFGKECLKRAKTTKRTTS